MVAISVKIPHFDLPFRFLNGSAVVVEQDSFEDISNCVEAIVRTPLGFRIQDGSPDFGIPRNEFSLQPIGTETIKAVISDQEPRADLMLEEKPDAIDVLIDRITVEIVDHG